MTESNTTEIEFLREKLVEKEQKSMRMVEAISRIMGLANSQGNEPSLWRKDPVLYRSTHVQIALRALHTAIDNEWRVFADSGHPKLEPQPLNPPPGETL